MNRDRSHSSRGNMAKLRATRWLTATVMACLLGLALTSLGASAAVRVASPGASPSAVKHTTRRKKHVACKKTKKKGKKHASCRKPSRKHKTPTRAKRTTAKAPTGPSPALFNREVYGFRSTLSPQADARRYSVIVLQGTDAAMVPALRAGNPHLKIFVYVDILRAVVGGAQSCTSLAADQAQHPNWLLSGTNGQAIDVANVYHLDIGNPAYQQACVNGAIAQARAGHFDGVYFDGVDSQPAYGFGGAAPPVIPRYTNLAVWQAAITSLLERAEPQIHSAGLQLIGNIGGETPSLFQRWEGLMDGAEDESFTDDTGGTAQWLYWWPDEISDMKWSEAHGKLLLVHSHNKTEAGNAYGLATMLMAAGGHTSYSTANGNYAGYEQWYPEYTTAQVLGAPRGGYTRGAGGIYERRFAHGIVLVNPSTHSVGGIGLGGTYSGTGLTNVSRVTLGPTSGLILRAG